jgi:hypothetical protein
VVSSTITTSIYSNFVVLKKQSTATIVIPIGLSGGQSIGAWSDGNLYENNGQFVSVSYTNDTNQNLFSVIKNGNTLSDFSGTQNASTLGSYTGNPFISITTDRLGARSGTYSDGNLQEIVLYSSNQSSNRTGIRTNINAQYQIYWDGSQTSLLDSYGGSAAAYSLRALSSAYVGPLVRVRRASDNAEQDIYANYDGTLNTSSLESFCSGTNGFVTEWYDQSGSGNNATQGTALNQPQIVSSGSVILENAKPALEFDGSNEYLILNSTLSLLTSHSNFSVANNNNKSVAVLYGSTSPTSNFNSDSGNFTYNAAGSFAQTGGFQYGQKLLSVLRNNTTTINIFQNTTSYSILIGSNNNFTIKEIARRADLGSYLWFGNIQEIVLYPSDQSTNRTGIETNINDFYSIY